MIVYIVVRGENYEGSNVEGVFSIKEKAEELKSSIENDGICSCEYVDILEWELDGKQIEQPSIPGAAEKQIQLCRDFLQRTAELTHQYESSFKDIVDKLNKY